MYRTMLVFIAVLLFVAPAASAQNTKMDATKVHMVNDSTGAVVFTDYGNCRVVAKHGLKSPFLEEFGIEIITTKGDTTQHVTMHRTIFPEAVNGVRIEDLAHKFDRTKGLDLINRQCAMMLRAIPDSVVRDFAMKVLVK